MCLNGMCLFCMKVETGSYIFAVINVITAAGSCVGVVVWLIIYNANLYTHTHNNHHIKRRSIYRNINQSQFSNITRYGGDHGYMGIDGNVVIAVALLSAIIYLIFSVLLIKGLTKKKTILIKAYIGYGVLKFVILFLAATLYMPIIAIPATAYALILAMIYITLKMISKTKENNDVDDKSIHVMENLNYSELNLLE